MKKDIPAQVQPVISNLFLTKPLPASNLYHIFNDNDKRSLCGKFGMLINSEDMVRRISGRERYKRGQDCKACFKKAGLSC